MDDELPDQPTEEQLERRLAETVDAIKRVAQELANAEELMAIVLRRFRVVAERTAKRKDPSFIERPHEPT
jgi:hypothetical protein